jgi:DNA-binding response OmpR family regulator
MIALILLLDVSLPDMSGFEVLQQLHAIAGPQPPVMMMTAMADDASLARAQGLGVVDYIIKGSFDIDDLLDRVERHIRA